eukprot:TRINITY_DN1908_c0_g1_i1.p1 TRINITY_DN1908_c0_g1~~TRINITY_DN1908_c0_g1_i1.p1  ORF type:complete len:234 (+),score=40.09 TRINITY_DN1908_c0_g1_i1:91-792(+)
MERLPKVLIKKVYSYLSFKDIINCSFLNKKLNSTSIEIDTIWEELYYRDFKMKDREVMKDPLLDWRQKYKMNYERDTEKILIERYMEYNSYPIPNIKLPKELNPVYKIKKGKSFESPKDLKNVWKMICGYPSWFHYFCFRKYDHEKREEPHLRHSYLEYKPAMSEKYKKYSGKDLVMRKQLIIASSQFFIVLSLLPYLLIFLFSYFGSLDLSFSVIIFKTLMLKDYFCFKNFH